ncbi:MAG: sensor histidine kinase [Kiritimatiellae bacterium]|nr:sensor histidine kinase [Kiritimatiellia bacterium]
MKRTELVSEINSVVNFIKDFKTEALLPVFEAVVNSIQAIEDRNGLGDNGEIIVVINRDRQGDLFGAEGRREPEIESFEIVDNGIGFTKENFDSFMKVGSKYKIERGGKGVGRFTWLKAFKSVKIDSVYLDKNGVKKGRTIDFSMDFIADKDYVPTGDAPIQTCVKLDGFLKKYKSSPSACRTGKKIAQRITEHCLYYFITNKCPRVSVVDKRPDGKDEKYELGDIYKGISDHLKSEPLPILGKNFVLYHLKIYGTNAYNMHKMVLCANGREVETFDLKKDLGLGSQFDDADKKFTYAVYVTSPYLDAHVSADRMNFELSDEDTPAIEDSPIGLNRIKMAIVAVAKKHLAPYLERLAQRRIEVVDDYVSNRNPALRFVSHYCPEAIEEIDPNTDDARIDEVLYSYKGKAEFKIRKKSAELLRTHSEDHAKIIEDITKIEGDIENVQKDNLANYVIFRKLIIDLLERKLALCPDGKYEKEEVIHDIIMPRKLTSNEINVEGHNLWLIDERLTFHSFAASDKPLNKIGDSKSEDRPDIVVVSEVDKVSRVARSVAIVELKRPERSEYQEPITEQVYRMHDEIKSGRALNPITGRKILVDDATRYYCYALCDFNDKIEKAAKYGGYHELPGKYGYFRYNAELKIACYVIRYDQIVADAKQRNFAFFEKLGIND